MSEKYIALRQLRFALPDGEQIVVEAGQAVPEAAWASCDARQRDRIRDPHARKVAPA
jgi:hypothetical protein